MTPKSEHGTSIQDIAPAFERALKEISAAATQMTAALQGAFGQANELMAKFGRQIVRGAIENEKAARWLGQHSWTVAGWLPPTLPTWLHENIAPEELDEAFLMLYADENRANERALFEDLSRFTILARWRPIIRQCLSIYRRRQYIVVVPAVVSVLEGLVMAGTLGLGSRRTDFKAVAQSHGKKLIPGVDRMIWLSVEEFLGVLAKPARFDEPLPGWLNRHWVVHGRAEPSWSRIDCLRLLQAVASIALVLDEATELASAAAM